MIREFYNCKPRNTFDIAKKTPETVHIRSSSMGINNTQNIKKNIILGVCFTFNKTDALILKVISVLFHH